MKREGGPRVSRGARTYTRAGSAGSWGSEILHENVRTTNVNVGTQNADSAVPGSKAAATAMTRPSAINVLPWRLLTDRSISAVTGHPLGGRIEGAREQLALRILLL